MPAEIEWKKLTQKGEVKPQARSGHTLNWVGGQNYMLYGGIEEQIDTSSKDEGLKKKIAPNTDIYLMKLAPNEVTWTKETANGDCKPLGRSQHVAVTTPKTDKVFVFGGHHSPQVRLNDTWFFNIKELEWRRVGDEGDNMSNQPSTIGAPAPRANMGCCLYEGKIYIQGGHGGIGYARTAFNDIFCFDIESETWTKLETVSEKPPEQRGGHSLFANDNKLYIYGGWNMEMHFNTMWYFDLETKEWVDCDLPYDIPRWNHSGALVEAIPTWKYFIFGGESNSYTEGEDRTFGSYCNSSCYLDCGALSWTQFASDAEAYPNIPSPREYAAMAYDGRDRRLLVYGGWNNGWYDDLYALNVSKIVGPPYAITASEPNMGQLSGGVKLRVSGRGFKDLNIRVLFTCGNKPIDSAGRMTKEVPGVWKSDTQIECITPSFDEFGPKEAVMQIAIGSEDITTTHIPFYYFLNTRANKSLCYGPGILQGAACGHPVEFTIQARNDLGENRTSGRDNFEVKVIRKVPIEEAPAQPEGEEGAEAAAPPKKEEAPAAAPAGEEGQAAPVADKPKFQEVEIPCEIIDHDDGRYSVKYTSDEPGEVQVRVSFLDDKGKMVEVRGSPYSATFVEGGKAVDNTMTGAILDKHIKKELERLQSTLADGKKEVTTKDKELKNVKVLLKIKENVEKTQTEADLTTLQIDQLDEALKLFQSKKLTKDAQLKGLVKINKEWNDLKKLTKDSAKEISSHVAHEDDKNKNNIKKLEESITQFTQDMRKREFFQYTCGTVVAKEKLDGVFDELRQFEDQIADLGYNAEKFGKPELINKAVKDIESIKVLIGNMKALWDHIGTCQTSFESFMQTKWIETKPFEMEDEVKKLLKALKDMKVDKRANAYIGVLDEIKKWLVFLPLIAELADDAMRTRHWDALKTKVGVQFEIDNNLMLQFIYDLNLGKYQDDVEEITDQAKQEAKMEKTLERLDATWKDIMLEFTAHKDSGFYLIRLSEDNFDILENDQTSVSAMFSSRYLATFEDKINFWNKALAQIGEIVVLLQEVQRTWSFLESLFIHSEEVKKELPNESAKFVHIDRDTKAILSEGYKDKKALDFCCKDHVLPGLEKIKNDLSICEVALNDFVFQKKIAFARFFFVSQTDLLDILSNGNQPVKVMKHMPKIFGAIGNLELLEEGVRPFVKGMHACVGTEYVEFTRELKLENKVEIYLQWVIDCMRGSLKDISVASIKKFQTIDKETWLMQDPSQVTLLINNCNWVIAVEKAFAGLKNDPKAMEKCFEGQKEDLKHLIMLVCGQLTKPVRQKVMCLITMDAHSRDIIEILLKEKVGRIDDFQWQTQLKGIYDSGDNDFKFKIADACLGYGYEYLGNGPRLVITPLTDRIYVTATQALHLKMGCAPAGPAGTGKTETTKDLSSALGKACYVFNCSDQMDYLSMAGIFRGLSASGSWGCFDEFNRLKPEVLSVCATQFKQVLDAIKAGKSRFVLSGTEIALDPTCGAFITMNPGYIGRAELPQDLKALFRPITVVVPDLGLICENMLMAEGFITAKVLAKKFVTLYFLCRDLLSKAAHYDWGLRAIKSVLVVAGNMKRSETKLQEDSVLMRALRDFNLPKIVADDLPIFHGLLNDLFPGLNPERKRDFEFEAVIKEVTVEAGMSPDENFLRKVVELFELLQIRHCVFTMGPPGAGKSSTWKTLAKAQDKVGKKTTCRDINPKVQDTDGLYGCIQMATREWKDGLLSNIMRALGEVPDEHPKWIIFDGDLDATWIESMNSVMDDNKLLTLASNERIQLKPHMRMIFEIRDLRFATPATVSRAGILFISDSDGYQWRAYVKSWIQNLRCDQEMKNELQEKFDKYLPETLLQCKKAYKHVIPQVEISMVMSICKLLQNIIANHEVKSVEYIFVFACVWCVGGGFTEKDGKDYRKEFSNWWRDKFKAVRFPGKTVFDYYVDMEQSTLVEWSNLATNDVVSTIDTSKAISSYTIPTVDTIATQFLMRQFINVKHSPILVGMAGCGKTQIIKGLLNELVTKTDDYMQQIINMNYYTDSTLLQMVLHQNLEKKAGTRYGPVGKYTLIYFIDDLNMPARDKFDTQSSIALLRQHRDYEHWYDRGKLQLLQIFNTQLVAAMNPTAGSFIVNPRLQRHFWLLAVGMPDNSSLSTIYSAYLTRHFGKFKASILEQVPIVIKATLLLHADVTRSFRKTAANFHYEFNVRHLTNVFQGLLNAKPEAIKEPDNLIRLWVHEAERIYGDRLVNQPHLAKYRELAADISSKSFPKFNLKKYFGATPEPLIFAQFVGGLDEKLYDQFPNVEAMDTRLKEGLREYNEVNAVMDLVLFEDAMKHTCKICRIIAADQGHALLVGVGGSGKQSLTRLSSFICGYTTVSIMISSTYGMNDLKADLQKYYLRCGVKDDGLCFLFTEGQITNEKFLVYLNDLLSSGEIADLFAAEDIDGIVNNVRPAVKGEGLVDSKDNCWNFFINRVKKNLHMSLCFSPVGEGFRQKATKFPALITATVIDWFHPWPQDALLSVAEKFLADVEMDSDEIRAGIVKFMPYSFAKVDEFSARIMIQERRPVYTTPKSFLELIGLFKLMLSKKKGDLEKQKDQYETGVIKLTSTSEEVAKLDEELKLFAVEVEAAAKVADEKATVVGGEKVKVEAQNAVAEKKAAECAVIKTNVEAQMEQVKTELAAAIPALEKAQAALDSLTLADFRDLKAFKTPKQSLITCGTAVLHLLATVDDGVPVDKKGNLKAEKPWSVVLALLGNPQGLLDRLLGFQALIDTGKVPASNFKACKPILEDPEFTAERLSNVSKCAAGLCGFVININVYYDIVVEVEPKKKAVAAAEAELAEANANKAEVDALVAKLNSELQVLLDSYNEAMATKQKAMDEAAACERKLNLAQRLVGALGSEQERWSQSIVDLTELLKVIIGDVLLASAFVSYVGPFNKQFRDEIINDNFIPFFEQNGIPKSADPNPLTVLTDDAEKAGWNNNGLPPDRVSTENGAILTNSKRTTLMIDPQLQGVAWIRRTWEPKGLKVTRLSHPKMVKIVEFAVEAGDPVLIESIFNTVDAVIQPVYAKQITKKGKSQYIKMGDKELSLAPTFQLFLQTKLSNPHYPPEIQAECTLINFTVTEGGLEDQLLSLVVKKERPDLAASKEALIQQGNEFKIKLQELEKDLLQQLADADSDTILENIALIESLEGSKKLSTEIKEKVEIAKVNEVEINTASEHYRPAASRGALVFFLMNELYKIHSFYKFSLDSFLIVVKRAIDIVAEAARAAKAKNNEGDDGEGEEGEEGAEEKPAEEGSGEDEEEKPQEMSPEELKARVEALTESVTFQGFNFTRRGTLEDHKLIISTMLCFRILIRQGKVAQNEYDALIKKELAPDPPLQAESLRFLPETAWAAVKGLEALKIFENLGSQMETDALLWRKWYIDERPESCDMPKQFANISLFHRTLLLRAMRPDRLTYALREFVQENMGVDYVEQPPFDIVATVPEMNPQTPTFFVLFPGVNPVPDIEMIANAAGKTAGDGSFIYISMGQGQEETANAKLKEAGKAGHWALFANVHLMQDWMKILERNFEIVLEEGAHPEFRMFLTSEPPPLPHLEIIPESILQNALKVANEAPRDIKSNIKRAFSKFPQEDFERAKSHKENEFKALLFGLCMFHSLILGRTKFGSQGWSRKYDFNDGDLRICGDILHNYLSGYEQVPYRDLQYLYGEIMYGGHITDNWDRRTNETYLAVLIRKEILDNMQLTLAQGFRSPYPNKMNVREDYITYVDEKLPAEIPQMFGLHPNAEIGYLTTLGEKLAFTILSCSGGGGGGASGKDEIVKEKIVRFLTNLPEEFSLLELNMRAKERTPYVVVCLQESERMNTLTFTLRQTLEDLDAGLKGALNITEDMEELAQALFLNVVPGAWVPYAYPSLKDLGSWYDDLLLRIAQLAEYGEELIVPKSLWISGLFNPMSFLTAIMQVTARANSLALDDMTLQTDITNVKDPAEIPEAAPVGAYVHGFTVQGASWELGRGSEQGNLAEMVPKELTPELPVMHVTAVEKSKHVTLGYYRCPVYITSARGATYVTTAWLKMEAEDAPDTKWILAGVALIMQPE